MILKCRKHDCWPEWRSTCCCAGFMEPGWPESDICAKCGEHSGAYDQVEEDKQQEHKEPHEKES